MLRVSRHRRRRGAALGIPALMLVTALADCAGHGRPHDDARANVYPENYKVDLLGFLHSYINDANKIRDAAISEPVLRPVPAAPASGGGPMAISGGLVVAVAADVAAAAVRPRAVVAPAREEAGCSARATSLRSAISFACATTPRTSTAVTPGSSRGWRFISVAASTAFRRKTTALRRGRIKPFPELESLGRLGSLQYDCQTI